jgi:antitoxin VapB
LIGNARLTLAGRRPSPATLRWSTSSSVAATPVLQPEYRFAWILRGKRRPARRAACAFSPSAYVPAYAQRERAMERHVKLFRNGRNQAVRIPREFELPGTDAIMRKEGDRLVLELAPKHSIDRLLAALATLEDLPEDEQLPEIEDLPPEPFDL